MVPGHWLPLPESEIMNFTASPVFVDAGDKRGTILSNGQSGPGQSMRLQGTINAPGDPTHVAQVDVRTDDLSVPFRFDPTKQYTVTVEEVTP